MSRVVAVTDSRTIVVETDGARSTVALKGVVVAAEEETAAADFLRRLVSGGQSGIEAMRKFDLENGTGPAEPFRIYRRTAKS